MLYILAFALVVCAIYTGYVITKNQNYFRAMLTFCLIGLLFWITAFLETQNF